MTHERSERRPGEGEGLCPQEVVQDEAFQEVAEVVTVLQSLKSQREGVLGHGGHDEPAASGTAVNGASHLGGMGENLNVPDQDAQLQNFQLLGGRVLQAQVS